MMARKIIILVSIYFTCQSLNAQLTVPWSNSLNINFGRGQVNPGPPLQRGKTDFTYTTDLCPPTGSYTILNQTNCGYLIPSGLNRDAGISYYGPFQYALPQTDSGGYMMVVNAAVSSVSQTVFQDTVRDLCSSTEYLFWTALSLLQPGNCNNQSFTYSIETTSGAIIKSWKSGNFDGDTTVYVPPNWITVPTNDYAYYFNYYASYNEPPTKSSFPFFYGFFFSIPQGIKDVVVKIKLDPSSAFYECFFPFALDNIIVMPVSSQIQIADPDVPSNWIIGSCFDGSNPLILNGTINYDSVVFGRTRYAGKPYSNPQFQWQQSLDGGYTWADIPGENKINLNRTFRNPDTFLVRLRGADGVDFNNLNCNVVSNAIKVDVDALPKQGEYTFTSNSPVCEDSDIVFNLSGGASYLTTGPNGFNDNSAHPHVYHPSLADSGWYYTEVKTFGGCATLDSIFVKIVGPPIKVGMSDSVCYGVGFQLSSSGGVKYEWSPVSGLSNPKIADPIAKPFISTKYIVQITDSAGCGAFGNQTVYLRDSALTARIISPDYACPNDIVEVKDTSIGKIISWHWDFGNGKYSEEKNPPNQKFPASSGTTVYHIVLTVTDTANCINSTFTIINAEANCYIAVASAFTPNGDGLNDYLYPINAFKATDLLFRVYNRYGELIFETKDWTRKWDGTRSGIAQPTGTYIWMLDYTDENHKKISLHGTSVLIR